jgi:hypothetical protein
MDDFLYDFLTIDTVKSILKNQKPSEMSDLDWENALNDYVSEELINKAIKRIELPENFIENIVLDNFNFEE